MKGLALVRAARLVLLYGFWRGAGLPTAGRALVRALGSPEEDARTIAGMLLVRAGPRAVPLLREALERRESLALTLALLGDIGDPGCERDLLRFAGDPDPVVARAAHEGLRVLAAR